MMLKVRTAVANSTFERDYAVAERSARRLYIRVPAQANSGTTGAEPFLNENHVLPTLVTNSPIFNTVSSHRHWRPDCGAIILALVQPGLELKLETIIDETVSNQDANNCTTSLLRSVSRRRSMASTHPVTLSSALRIPYTFFIHQIWDGLNCAFLLSRKGLHLDFKLSQCKATGRFPTIIDPRAIGDCIDFIDIFRKERPGHGVV
jgi:hypothetical protein